jgi:hypothetical protein
MKAVRISIMLFLLSLGTCVVGAKPAEAFGWYRANDPARIDWCYRGPAWDYAAPYYTSRRYRRARCHGYCCKR